MFGHRYIGGVIVISKLGCSNMYLNDCKNQIESNDSIRVDGKQLSSSFAKHIVETGHNIDLNTDFAVLYEGVKGLLKTWPY